MILDKRDQPYKKVRILYFQKYFQTMVHFFYLKIDSSTKKLLGKNQKVLAKGRNFLREPVTSGRKFLV